MTLRYLIYRFFVLFLFANLTGCLGGSIAQQFANSMATGVADSAVATAVAHAEKKDAQHRQLESIQGNLFGEYWGFFATSGFEPNQAIESSLPAQITLESEPQTISSQLVRVVLINMLAGEEKEALLKKALMQPNELSLINQKIKNWRVGTGLINDTTQEIIFLIPPELGKLPSGSIAMVEMSSKTNFYIARYVVNER